MDYRSLKWLSDIQKYTDAIPGLVDQDGWSFAHADPIARLAIERSFEIVGIALTRLERHSEPVAAETSRLRPIAAFRNRIAHGYEDDLNPSIFDEAILDHLPILRTEVADLLDQLSEGDSVSDDGVL